jgi:hypothetical protein
MSDDQKLGCITLEEQLTREVSATGADVFINIRGSSMFTGQAALTKAKEVAALVESLVGAGLQKDQIFVHNVCMSVESGTFSKSSSAQYMLKIKVDIDLLSEVLTAIANSKSGTLQRIEWRYDEPTESELAWIEEGLVAAKAKAERVARGLDTKIIGLRDCLVTKDPPARTVTQFSDSLGSVPTMARYRTTVDLGMPIAQVTEKTVYLNIRFQVEPK